jgi:hypothetical protein
MYQAYLCSLVTWLRYSAMVLPKVITLSGFIVIFLTIAGKKTKEGVPHL